MAKSHERVIVDVRDLFGQAKDKVDLPEQDPPPKAPTPGGGLSQVGWGNGALGEYKPRVCSTGNGDVFFGGPGGPPSTGRRRQAPRAPVMIDMDVGIDEQLPGRRDVTDPAAADPPRPEGPWSFGPPVAKGGGDGSRSRGQLGPSDDDGTSRAGASSGSAAGGGVNINAPSVMNGRAPGRPANKYEGRPLPPPPAPPPPPAQPPAANHHLKTTTTTTTSAGAGAGGRVGAKDVTTGRVSNVSLGAKTPHTPSHHPGGGRAAVGGGTGGGGGGGGGSANSQASLNRSSSGVETDDNGTPNGTIQTPRSSSTSTPDRGRPAAPSQPPPAPPASTARDSSYHSEDDDSDFEDEATLVFDDEDEDGLVEGGRKQLFVEYHGDDYGQFLNDDPVADPGVAPRGRKKRQRRKKKDGEVAPGSTVSSTENDTVNKKRTLKGRLAAVFMGSVNGTTQKAQPEVRHVETGSTIHTFSFADSKIGNYMQGPAGAADSLYGTTSGSGPELAQCDSAYGGDRKWWNTDTLSARTLASNSDVMLRSRRASAANGNNFLFQSKPNPDPAINGSDEGVETGAGMDFESQRKSVIYGVHTDRKSQSRSIFRRFKKDANPGVASLLDNTVTNPLTAMEGVANDTRF